MNAYRAIKRGEEIEKPQNWLIKIAHNAARSRYARASRRVNEVPLEDHLEQLAVPEVEKVQLHEVLDALGLLPLNQRAALVMRELEGRTYAEIADTLDVSVSAVETLIFRARRSLRVKASAIRVLGVVPAPGWLWNLLEGGGVAGGGAAVGGGALGGSAVAGGGSIVSSGLLLKAAVAIVAGIVASGVNSDRPRQADAARTPLSSVSMIEGSQPPWAGVLGGGAQPGGQTVTTGAGAALGQVIPGAERAVVAGNPLGLPPSITGGAVVVGNGDTTGAGTGGSSVSPATVASPGGPQTSATPLGTASQVVSTTVGTVTNAVPLPGIPSVPSAPVGVPLPPVQVPSPPVRAPSPPVQLPAPPPVQVPSPPVPVPAPPAPLQPPPLPLPHP
jgi:RNA polymerase sigma factor (sigma-70 family)